ncbi:MAG: MarR family transcriptional regulator [Burkholderiaceae bacterium]|nr:MarR family transcriptional regulator [Burkholderiaceae bacterium]
MGCPAATSSASTPDRMSSAPKDNASELTPSARLSEGALHGVVGYQLAQATIVATQVFAAAAGRAFDLRPVEYTVLALVHANPEVNGRRLARSLAVTPPNIVAWLDRLESRGLVERSRSSSDARLVHIRTTAAGAALVEGCTRALLDAEGAALASLSAAERAMLVELLHKVALARRRGASA